MNKLKVAWQRAQFGLRKLSIFSVLFLVIALVSITSSSADCYPDTGGSLICA